MPQLSAPNPTCRGSYCELVSVDTVSLFIEKSFIIICSSDLVSSLFLLQFLPMGASECELGISTALHWQINSHRPSINRHKDKHVICHKNMKICRAETNMLKIRNYCREYPVIPADLNHLLLLYEPIDKTSYAYGLQGSTANRAAINFQSYRRKKGFISTTFLILVFFTLLAII